MKATVHFLNVGWGDAHFIRLPSGALTLIDGGDDVSVHGADTPLAWMERHQAEQLDWMIVTHLHADHLMGLLAVASNKKVANAVLPYEPFPLPVKEQLLAGGEEVAETVFRLLDAYLHLIALLEAQGTKLIWRSRFSSTETAVIWSQEGYTLRHLFPWADDALVAWPVLAEACAAERFDDEWRGAFHRFYDLSNYDSSVYRLTCEDAGEQESVLFGGDQLEPGWVKLAARIVLPSHVWKAPHHGMEDGVSRTTLELVKPVTSVFTMSKGAAAAKQDYWASLGLQNGRDYHVTSETPVGETVCIWDGPIQVFIGS